MFGAKKFQFYVQSSTAELETCLNKYQQLGIVDVQPWEMPQQLIRDKVGYIFLIFRFRYMTKYLVAHKKLSELSITITTHIFAHL